MVASSSLTHRQNYVDIAKAFAIIAVVFGHIDFQYPDLKLLPIQTLFATLWHVPVFFMIGGFFLTEDKLIKPGQFIKGKILKLYLPILYIYIPAVLLHNVFMNIGYYSNSIEYGGKYVTYWNFKEYSINILKSIFFAGREPVMGAMWFAFVLFLALCMMSLTYWASDKIINKIQSSPTKGNSTKLFAVLLLIGGVAGSILTNKFDFTIPRCSNVFTAAWLIFVGMMVRQKYDVKFDNPFCFVISFIVFYSFGVLRGGVSLNGNNFDDIASLTISTLSALYVICFVARKLSGWISKLMALVGRDSFWIMGLHFIAFKICTIVLNCFGCKFDIAVLCPNCEGNILLLIYYLLGGVLLPVVCVNLVRRIKSGLSRNDDAINSR